MFDNSAIYGENGYHSSDFDQPVMVGQMQIIAHWHCWWALFIYRDIDVSEISIQFIFVISNLFL
ncbi:hypothetical protein D3C76_187390 [compost metagenome]